jgi:hypothetical protein
VKHLLWQGNVQEALERMDSLVLDLSMIQARSAPAKKLAGGMAEFEIYIGKNREFIPNFGERYRNGETISTLCRIDYQSGGQQALCQAAIDAVDAA